MELTAEFVVHDREQRDEVVDDVGRHLLAHVLDDGAMMVTSEELELLRHDLVDDNRR